MIKDETIRFSIKLMCRLLDVSVSGYYAWVDRKPSNRTERNRDLAKKIKAIFDEERSRAGAPRITKRLNNEGERVGKQGVAKIMCEQGWRAKASRKFKATTNSNHQLPVAPNLLQQNFCALTPNEKWVSDITYCHTEAGWLYLAVVMDLYARKVVGWALSERMSKRGDCYDNAAMESWNHSFKVEVIHGEKFLSRATAKNHIFEYIEIYYNRKRLYSRLGYQSPDFYEVRKVA